MKENKNYHLIGIGGIGMSAIAQLLIRRGMKVSGSDLKENKNILDLKGKGASISIGHDKGNIGAADVVVYSSAIKEDNPEIIEARRLGLSIIKRAEALARLMNDKIVVTVTGSHGKTTTSSLCSYMLLEAELLPTIAVGGILKNIGANATFGEGKFFVAEADESDGSFLYYSPDYSIITNMDYEHLDYYKTFDNVKKSFREFMSRTKPAGCLFFCSDDKNLSEIAGQYPGRSVSFGHNRNADVFPGNIILNGLASEFDCSYKGRQLGRFSLALGGEHNISNALSVIALGMELGLDMKVIKKALSNYKGAGRRLEIKFKNRDFLVIDDYAHHPTEIKATLSAIRNLKQARTIAVFQPHRYSRTKLLLDDFAGSFDRAAYVIITDIYSASENPIEGVSAEGLAAKIKQHSSGKPVFYLPKQELAQHILKLLKPGDLVITLGAGDITKISDEVAEALKSRIAKEAISV